MIKNMWKRGSPLRMIKKTKKKMALGLLVTK